MSSVLNPQGVEELPASQPEYPYEIGQLWLYDHALIGKFAVLIISTDCKITPLTYKFYIYTNKHNKLQTLPASNWHQMIQRGPFYLLDNKART